MNLIITGMMFHLAVRKLKKSFLTRTEIIILPEPTPMIITFPELSADMYLGQDPLEGIPKEHLSFPYHPGGLISGRH